MLGEKLPLPEIRESVMGESGWLRRNYLLWSGYRNV